MDLEAGLDAATALGVAILAVPVFSLNFRKKSHTRLDEILAARRETGAENALDRIGAALRDERARDAARWRPVDELCLYAGYVLLLSAAVARIFV